MTHVHVKTDELARLEIVLHRALQELSLTAPSLANVENARRDLSEALRLSGHMRRTGEEMVVIPFFNRAEQRDALGRHVRAERAQVVNPNGG